MAIMAGTLLLIFSTHSCKHESLETEITGTQQNPIAFIKNEYLKGKEMLAGKTIEWEKAREYKYEENIVLITVPIKNENSNTIEELSFRVDKNMVSGHLWKFQSNEAFSPEDYNLTAHKIMEKMTGTVSYASLEGSIRYEKKIVGGAFIEEAARNGFGPMSSPSCKPCHGEIDNVDIPPPGKGVHFDPNPGVPTVPVPGTITPPKPNQPDTPQNTDLCTKGKKVQNSEQVKQKVKDLKDHAKKGNGEKGFKVKADGSTSDMIDGGKHEVDLGDKMGFQGGFHNHTSLGISMLSPDDIDILLGFARAQGNQGNNIQNAFIGMVGPDGTQYIGWFNGSYQDAITNFSQEQMDAFENDYRDLENLLSSQSQYSNNNGATLNNKGLEKLFSDILKKIGLNGKIGLQKINPEDKMNNINFDDQGSSTDVPCPN